MALPLKDGNTKFITISEFTDWMSNSKPGDQIVYAIGMITFKGSASIELGIIARMAMEWSDDGRISLVQRRRGAGCYEYIAQRKYY
jgi:hypothetical protein